MSKKTTTRIDEEPVGIVISGGSRTEATPKLSAYVWGPAPEFEKSAEMVAA